MCKEFVKIPKRLFEERWWSHRRTFSEIEAFVDLYQSADDKNMMIVSMRALADKWSWEKIKVFRFLSRLSKAGYVKTSKCGNGTAIEILEGGVKVTPNVTPEIKKCNGQMLTLKGFEACECNTSDTESVTPKEKKPRKKSVFQKPTVEEVRAYISEKGYGIDAEYFWNFYEANGWVQGKSMKPIKNWKACVTTWIKQGKYETSTTNQQHSQGAGNPSDGEVQQQSIRIIERLRAERKVSSPTLWD